MRDTNKDITVIGKDGLIHRVPVGTSQEAIESIRNGVGSISQIRTDLTTAEWNDMADTKLQDLLQTATGSLLLAAIRESKDRIEGKPMVRTQNLNVNTEKRVTESDEAILARFGLKIP